MADINARDMTIREINSRVKELVKEGQEVQILDPQARHNLVIGVLQDCKITVDGSVGYLCASLLDGPDVTINGNAGWALGENMMSGRITLTRNAGASVGATLRGGELFVGWGRWRKGRDIHEGWGPDNHEGTRGS